MCNMLQIFKKYHLQRLKLALLLRLQYFTILTYLMANKTFGYYGLYRLEKYINVQKQKYKITSIMLKHNKLKEKRCINLIKLS